MAAYYNEHDEQKAAWLRELIRRNVIADGEVDERDIKLIQPEDPRGFAQCHFFAGVGVWSYALRLAGWPDDRECWTGSCPCPSFSAAGQGKGFDDARHLWPDWVRLIRVGKPAVIFGEQADDAIGYGWLDLVQTDLEAEAYAVGKAVLGACSVGGSDIRQRLYWMAYAEHSERRPEHQEFTEAHRRNGSGRSGDASRLADSNGRQSRNGTVQRSGQHRLIAEDGEVVRLANALQRGRQGGQTQLAIGAEMDGERCPAEQFGNNSHDESSELAYPDALNGFWRDADWLLCTDGFWRPVEAGTFPLAHGAPCRLGRLRGYGDAINAEVAKAFIEAAIECGIG